MDPDIQIVEYADASIDTKQYMDEIIANVLSDSDNAATYGKEALAPILAAEKEWPKIVDRFNRGIDKTLAQIEPFKKDPRNAPIPVLLGVLAQDHLDMIENIDMGRRTLAEFIGTASEITRRKKMSPTLEFRFSILRSSFDASKTTRDLIVQQLQVVNQLNGMTTDFEEMKRVAIEAEKEAARKAAEESAAKRAAEKAKADAADAKKAAEKAKDNSKDTKRRSGWGGFGGGGAH